VYKQDAFKGFQLWNYSAWQAPYWVNDNLNDRIVFVSTPPSVSFPITAADAGIYMAAVQIYWWPTPNSPYGGSKIITGEHTWVFGSSGYVTHGHDACEFVPIQLYFELHFQLDL
jgi:hypothetical protein